MSPNKTNRDVSDNQREAIAITVMRYMLSKYAEDNQLSFEDALLEFTQSRVYNMLFDYETGTWKEGPDYLRALYDEEKKHTSVMIS